VGPGPARCREPAPRPDQGRCRVLYVSPLKALAVDVERNLRSPPWSASGTPAPASACPAPRSPSPSAQATPPPPTGGPSPSDPSDILITTPESLFLLLTSAARESLAGVETVILDEVHAVAGTKRGAHLAVTLERLDALLERPAQRIGLSATVRPIEEVARFLAAGRPVDIVAPPSTKEWDLEVVVPVPDSASSANPPATCPARRGSRPDGLDLAARRGAHRRPRRQASLDAGLRQLAALAERLTARLNEIWDERTDEARRLARSTPQTGHRRHKRGWDGSAHPCRVGQAGPAVGCPRR
jgi:ATP-dependent Lhr-like helicase